MTYILTDLKKKFKSKKVLQNLWAQQFDKCPTSSKSLLWTVPPPSQKKWPLQKGGRQGSFDCIRSDQLEQKQQVKYLSPPSSRKQGNLKKNERNKERKGESRKNSKTNLIYVQGQGHFWGAQSSVEKVMTLQKLNL